MLRDQRPFDLHAYPFMLELYSEDHRAIVVRKPAQVGVSEWAVSKALWLCDQYAAVVMYVFPTGATANDFSSSRINPAIEASPYLQSIVGYNPRKSVANAAQRAAANRVGLKRVGNGWIYVRAATVSKDGSASQLKSVDADAVFLDEVDEMDQRAIPIAQKRLLSMQSLGYQTYVSTPTYDDLGIDALYRDTDRRQWFVACEHCNHYQTMTVNHLVIEWDDLERPVAWHEQDGNPYLACEQCGKPLNRFTDRALWVPTNTSAPAPTRGYSMSRFLSPRLDLHEVLNGLSDLNPTGRREFFNQTLGLPMTPSGDRLTVQDLEACERDYAHGRLQPDGAFMGVDVGSVLHVCILGSRLSDGTRPLVYAGTHADFDDLNPLMRRFKVRRTVIDGLPETRSAAKFRQSKPRRSVYLAYYRDGSKWQGDFVADMQAGTIDIDRARALDAVIASLKLQEITLPADGATVPALYAQLTSLTRTLRESRGAMRVVHVETGPDHFMHALSYARVAADMRRAVMADPLATRSIKGWTHVN